MKIKINVTSNDLNNKYSYSSIYGIYSILILLISSLFIIAVPAYSSDAEPESAPANDIVFLSREDALEQIHPHLPESNCVRVPAWKLTIGEILHGGLSAHKPDVNCRDMFQDAVRDFTDEDKETLTYYIGLIDSIVKTEFPALASFPWSFVLISDSADFKSLVSVKHIVLTSELIGIMRKRMENQSSMKFTGLEILVHEKVRILQLISPEPFETFYSESWGFRKINKPLIARSLQERGLTFTSISPKEWVIKVSPKDKNYILPGLIRRDNGAVAGAGSFHRVAITVDSTSNGFALRKGRRKMPVDYRDLGTVTQYRKRFPLSQHDYDPSELSADLIAKYMVMKYVSSSYGTAPTFVDYSQIEKLMTSVDKVVY